MKFLLSIQALRRSFYLTAAFLLVTNIAMAKQPSQVGDAAAVNGVDSAFVRAWNVHDMDALAGLFAPDADFVNVVGMWWHGREEIRQAHIQSHQTIFKASTLAIDSTTVKFLSPELAVAHVVWTLKGHLTPDGTPGAPRQGILSFVMNRQEGSWLIESAQNTDIIPGVMTIPQGQQKPGK